MSLNVRIYKPSKNAMQSARGGAKSWVLEYETLSARTPDDLIGWTSAKDTLNQVKLNFKTLEHAVAHAVKNGWVYTVSSAHERKISPRNYGDNFKYFPPDKKSVK